MRRAHDKTPVMHGCSDGDSHCQNERTSWKVGVKKKDGIFQFEHCLLFAVRPAKNAEHCEVGVLGVRYIVRDPPSITILLEAVAYLKDVYHLHSLVETKNESKWHAKGCKQQFNTQPNTDCLHSDCSLTQVYCCTKIHAFDETPKRLAMPMDSLTDANLKWQGASFFYTCVCEAVMWKDPW